MYMNIKVPVADHIQVPVAAVESSSIAAALQAPGIYTYIHIFS
jgi:hypothetical protein